MAFRDGLTPPFSPLWLLPASNLDTAGVVVAAGLVAGGTAVTARAEGVNG
jgi:hypothetical protein